MQASDRRGKTGDRGLETVAALFQNQADAEQAVHDLRAAGFSREAMGVILRDPAFRAGAATSARTLPPQGESASTGASGAGILGGVVGLLAGAGALDLPGIGPVIAGGVLATSLTDAGPGAGAGGLGAALIRLGIADATARYFEAGVREGSVLVTVDSGARREAVRDILRFSHGDLGRGFPSESPEAGAAGEDEAWRGSERRYRDDPSYHGPERRYSHR